MNGVSYNSFFRDFLSVFLLTPLRKYEGKNENNWYRESNSVLGECRPRILPLGI